MGNTCARMRHFKDVFSSLMGESSESEYLAATATAHATSTSSPRLSALRESMVDKCGGNSSVKQQIDRSKCHWSETVKSHVNSNEGEVADNREVFKTLQMHPTWGHFFITFGDGEDDEGELVVGEKFAEGGQAELYHAHVKWCVPENNERDLREGIAWVLKVFKKGTSLRHLQSQWPHGYLQFQAEEEENWKSAKPKVFPRYYCDVFYGTLLEDGRFAFLLVREQEDLRSLIDRNMALRIGKKCGPFSKEHAERIMWNVALGIDWLHSRNIVHRDLKASNVLVHVHSDGHFQCFVADYECSIGVVGTGFFRAPEILQACKDKSVTEGVELFTKKGDTYSYGMICYEILTGKLPFDGHPLNDYDLVLNGHRPEVPAYVDDWARGLLSRCWQTNPAARPSFGEILNLLVANSAHIRKLDEERRLSLD